MDDLLKELYEIEWILYESTGMYGEPENPLTLIEVTPYYSFKHKLEKKGFTGYKNHILYNDSDYWIQHIDLFEELLLQHRDIYFSILTSDEKRNPYGPTYKQMLLRRACRQGIEAIERELDGVLR